MKLVFVLNIEKEVWYNGCDGDWFLKNMLIYWIYLDCWSLMTVFDWLQIIMVYCEWLHCLFSHKFQNVSNFRNYDIMTKFKYLLNKLWMSWLLFEFDCGLLGLNVKTWDVAKELSK
jgi:hypothetical protein